MRYSENERARDLLTCVLLQQRHDDGRGLDNGEFFIVETDTLNKFHLLHQYPGPGSPARLARHHIFLPENVLLSSHTIPVYKTHSNYIVCHHSQSRIVHVNVLSPSCADEALQLE